MKIVSRVLVYIFLGSRGVCIVYMPLVWGSRSRLGACVANVLLMCCQCVANVLLMCAYISRSRLGACLLSCVYLCGWD
jgi:hypothetical protein